MSKVGTLIEETDVPEFKNVLQNWDGSQCSNETANEMSKILKGQQPKAFLTWLIQLSGQDISPSNFKLKKDVIQECIRLLEDILLEDKSKDDEVNNEVTLLSCSVCKDPVQEDFLGEDIQKLTKTIIELKLNWICSKCKSMFENIKGVEIEKIEQKKEDTQNLENKNESDKNNHDKDEMDLNSQGTHQVAMDTVPGKHEAIDQGIQTVTVIEMAKETQTTKKETKNEGMQTLDQGLEKLNKQIQKLNQKEQVNSKSDEHKENTNEDLLAVNVVAETMNNSTQTETEPVIANELDEERREEIRKKIEREVEIAYEIKMAQEKIKKVEETINKRELKQHLELDKCQLEMERTKLELAKHDIFVEKQQNGENKENSSQNTLYNALLTQIEKTSLKRFEEKRNPRESVSKVEKDVLSIRKDLENIIDYGGDWRKTMDLLEKLYKVDDINLQTLTSTKIAWTVNDLRRYTRHPEVRDFARKVAKRFNKIMPKNYRDDYDQDHYKTSKLKKNLSPKRDPYYRKKSQNDQDHQKIAKLLSPSRDPFVRRKSETDQNILKPISKLPQKQHEKEFQNFTKTFENLQILDAAKIPNVVNDVAHICSVACINGHK